MNARRVVVLAGREVRSLLCSPVAYVAAALTLAISGLFLVAELSGAVQARLDGWFATVSVVSLFLAPVLAMRTVAEEIRSGTADVLLAGPVTELEVVLGKFLGVAAVYLGVLAATLPAPVLVALWGDPDPGPLLTGYLSLALLGLASVAVGVLASAVSPHQAVAAVVGFVVLLVLWLLEGLGDVFAGAVGAVLPRLGTTTHLAPFRRGLLDPAAVLYFLSLAVLALLGAARTLEARRWR